MEALGGLVKMACHAHLLYLGIMCSKFYLDDLKTADSV